MDKQYAIAPAKRDGKQYGWVVRLRRRGLRIDQFFTAASGGGLDGALQAAIAFRDEALMKVPPLTRRERCATLMKNNTSGVPGVCRAVEHGAAYWKAGIRFPDGRSKTRQFSIAKYGEARAFELAVEARRQLLETVEGTITRDPHAQSVDAQVPPPAGARTVLTRTPSSAQPRRNPFSPRGADHVPGVVRTTVTTRRKGGVVSVVAYWVAVVKEPDGRYKRRYFSIERFGDEAARQLAIEQLHAWKAAESTNCM